MAKVIDWVAYDDRYRSADIDRATNAAIKKEIKAHGYRFSAWAHQESGRGAPLLDDLRVARFSREAWGSLMVACHHAGATEEDKRFYRAHYKCDDSVPDQVLPLPERSFPLITFPVPDEVFAALKNKQEERMLLPLDDTTRTYRVYDCIFFERAGDPAPVPENVRFSVSGLYSMTDLDDLTSWLRQKGDPPLDEGDCLTPLPMNTSLPFLYIELRRTDD